MIKYTIYLKTILPMVFTAVNSSPSLLGGAVRRDAVLLRDGGQLFQELGVENDGKHSAFGFLGDGRAGREDAERRQRQRAPQGVAGERRVQDEVATLGLQTLWDGTPQLALASTHPPLRRMLRTSVPRNLLSWSLASRNLQA